MNRPTNDNASPLRWRLREETQSAHETLDKRVSAIDLTTEAGYVAFLKAQAAAYLSIAHLPQAPPQLAIRARLAMDDLSDLGITTGALHRIEWPGTPEPDPLGVGYVVGGSSLGHRLLLQRWAESDNQRLLRASRFMHYDGLTVLWRETLRALQQVGLDERRCQSVLQSAKACFRIFDLAFEAELSAS